MRYELPLAKEYVRHWGVVEGVRELIQNALDSESPFEYEFGPESLTIRSRFAKLTPETLLLGKTSKADNKDAIGSFGEGYKIAMLVIIRAGYDMTVFNGDVNWYPKFVRSVTFNSDVLAIEEELSPVRHEGLAFRIGGLNEPIKTLIRNSCLHMQDSVGEVIETRYGRILLNRPSKLYVGGLFVCDTELKYGYDVKPEYLRLERDRQTVSTFDLQWLAKDMWFESKRFDDIAKMMDGNVPDLAYAEHGCPELVKEACYKVFRDKNPTAVIAKSQDELKNQIRAGMSIYVHSSSAFVANVRSTPAYRAETFVKVATPRDLLEEWFDAHGRHMNRYGKIAFRELLKTADGWKR